MYTDMLYFYNLNHNYGKVAVTSTFAQESVGVINQKGELEHAVYDGEVTLENALVIQQNEVGYLTAFFGSPGYRKSDDDSWQFISSPDVLACIVIRGTCYSVIKDDKPYICGPSDPNYLTIKRCLDKKDAIKSSGNVVSFSDFKDRMVR